MLFIPLALLLGLPAAGELQAASAEHEHDGATSTSETEDSAGSRSRRSAARSSRSKSRRRARRGKQAKMEGHVVPESKLLAQPLPAPSGNLHLVNVARNEDLKVNIYNEDGSYNIESLKAITHLFRCKRTEAERDIEPRLLTILSHVYDHYGAPLELISGFRNQRKTTSYHYKASASDIRVPGVSAKQLSGFVETLDAGGMGVGYYPRSQFVHVDVRPPPSYRWIDYSSADPDSSDKKPPKGWRKNGAKKSRKLRS